MLGRPTRSTDPEVAQAALTAEHARFGDLFQLDGLTDGDNGDGGKTYSMFRAIYDESKDAPERRPIFVMCVRRLVHKSSCTRLMQIPLI